MKNLRIFFIIMTICNTNLAYGQSGNNTDKYFKNIISYHVDGFAFISAPGIDIGHGLTYKRNIFNSPRFVPELNLYFGQRSWSDHDPYGNYVSGFEQVRIIQTGFQSGIEISKITVSFHGLIGIHTPSFRFENSYPLLTTAISISNFSSAKRLYYEYTLPYFLFMIPHSPGFGLLKLTLGYKL